MLHTLVPIAVTLFLFYFLILAGFAVTWLFVVLRLFRQYLTTAKWKELNRNDLASRQTVDAMHWAQVQSVSHHLSDHQI